MSANKKGVLLLISRIIIGGIFIVAGWMKVADMAATIGYFHTMGIPNFLAYAVGYIELIGGALLVIGLWECIAAFALSVIMIVAVVLLSRPLGFGASFQNIMPALAVLGGLIALMPSGAGKFSISSLMGKGTE
jgi:uncharacterized membrane protein YphA (DoxX/SURF4 family)